MAETSTLARPYAQAVFQIAKAQQALPKWSETLALLSAVVSNDHVQAAIGNPRLTKPALATLILDVGGNKLDESAKNFVRLLVDNGRLRLVPDIAEQYDALRAEEESTMSAEVVSAFELSAEQTKQIAAALKKRLGRDVTVTARVDEGLLGGAIVRAGDLVIDGSASGQLQKLAGALNG